MPRQGMHYGRIFQALALGAGVLCASCAPNFAGTTEVSAPLAVPVSIHRAFAPGNRKKITHVIVVMQENRSFDNLFQGYPGADTVSRGMNSKGQTIPLQEVPLEASYGIEHSSSSFFAACNGNPPGRNCKMDGFDNEVAYGTSIPPNPQYAYVPHRETKLYFDMAKAYVLGDDMFTSNLDASFSSHQYIIAGQANHAVDLPSSLWGCGGGPSDTVVTLKRDRTYGPPESVCFDSTTIGDELDAKGLPWRFYSTASVSPGYIWSAYQAIGHIYNGPDWSNVVNPPAQFLTDVAGGSLAAVTWITPTCMTSDHSGFTGICRSNMGPAWVASVVNAVGESKFWDTAAIFVMWDEWGGWYDHVPPPYEDYDGLGMRVPLLVISPFAKKGHVSHVRYEHGSILRFIEDVFGLGRLAASDRRANSPASDCFDFAGSPRPFVPFKTTLKPRDFRGPTADASAPDDL
jgi:phospholipase C